MKTSLALKQNMLLSIINEETSLKVWKLKTNIYNKKKIKVN
jgi:hypothetical protein